RALAAVVLERSCPTRTKANPPMIRPCRCACVVSLSLASVMLLTTSAAVRGEDWPQWRGPRGDGTSTETNIPLKWSATENIAWKVRLAGRGYSSPVIWGDRIFLTSCLESESKHVTLCLDRLTGKILWEDAIPIKLQKLIHKRNSHASSTT